MATKPQVEITGLEAKYYDSMLNLITAGGYGRLIRRGMADMKLAPDDIVMDLGAGTGKNAEIMYQYLGEKGKIFALEIGEEMRRQLREKQSQYPGIQIINQRIEKRFELPEKVSVAFISFVIHGLKQEDRLKVVDNVFQNLKPGGKFCILDYNHFSVDDSPWYVRFGIRTLECKPTEEFISKDWPEILQNKGFSQISTHSYFKGYVRLLCAIKAEK